MIIRNSFKGIKLFSSPRNSSTSFIIKRAKCKKSHQMELQNEKNHYFCTALTGSRHNSNH